MSKYLKKLMIVPILMMSLGFVGCGEGKQIESDGLLNYYMGFNKENKFQKVNEDLKEMDNFTILNESESWVLDKYNDIDGDVNLIKVVNNDENVGDEIEIRYWKETGEFYSINYLKDDKKIIENHKGLYIQDFNRIMDTNEAYLRVMDKDSQKAYINIGKFNKEMIDYANPLIFDRILPNISYKKGDYEANLKVVTEKTKDEMTFNVEENEELEGDSSNKVIYVMNDNKEELLSIYFDENNTVSIIVYVADKDKIVGIKNENNGEKLVYSANTKGENSFEEKASLKELRDYINSEQ